MDMITLALAKKYTDKKIAENKTPEVEFEIVTSDMDGFSPIIFTEEEIPKENIVKIEGIISGAGENNFEESFALDKPFANGTRVTLNINGLTIPVHYYYGDYELVSGEPSIKGTGITFSSDGLTNLSIRDFKITLKEPTLETDTTLTKEGYAADAKAVGEKIDSLITGEWVDFNFRDIPMDFPYFFLDSDEYNIPKKIQIDELFCYNYTESLSAKDQVSEIVFSNNTITFSIHFTEKMDNNGNFFPVDITKTYTLDYKYWDELDFPPQGNGYYIESLPFNINYFYGKIFLSFPERSYVKHYDWKYYRASSNGANEVTVKNVKLSGGWLKDAIRGTIKIARGNIIKDYKFFANHVGESVQLEDGLNLSFSSSGNTLTFTVAPATYGINSIQFYVGIPQSQKVDDTFLELDAQVRKNEVDIFKIENQVKELQEGGNGSSNELMSELFSTSLELTPNASYGEQANEFNYFKSNVYFEQPTKIYIASDWGSFEYTWGERVFTVPKDAVDESLLSQYEFFYEYGEYTYEKDRKKGNYVKFWSDQASIWINPQYHTGIVIDTIKKESIIKQIDNLSDKIETKADQEDTLTAVYSWKDYGVSSEFPNSACPFYCCDNGKPTHVKVNATVVDTYSYNEDTGEYTEYEVNFEQEGFGDVQLSNGLTVGFIEIEELDVDTNEYIRTGIAIYIKGNGLIFTDPGLNVMPAEIGDGMDGQVWTSGTVSFYEPEKVKIKEFVKTLDSKVETELTKWYKHTRTITYQGYNDDEMSFTISCISTCDKNMIVIDTNEDSNRIEDCFIAYNPDHPYLGSWEPFDSFPVLEPRVFDGWGSTSLEVTIENDYMSLSNNGYDCLPVIKELSNHIDEYDKFAYVIDDEIITPL